MDTTVPQKAIPAPEYEIERRSAWAGIFIFFGVLSMIAVMVGVVISTNIMGISDRTQPTQLGILLMVLGAVSALQSFFVAFLVDVFTDIRWYLKKIADGSR